MLSGLNDIFSLVSSRLFNLPNIRQGPLYRRTSVPGVKRSNLHVMWSGNKFVLTHEFLMQFDESFGLEETVWCPKRWIRKYLKKWRFQVSLLDRVKSDQRRTKISTWSSEFARQSIVGGMRLTLFFHLFQRGITNYFCSDVIEQQYDTTFEKICE